MKAMLHALLALPLALSAATLNPGDEVTLDAVAKAEFITGEAPDAWNEGEVYILECWATWCGPCIAAIPHVDELYDKYHEKGLHVLGMNVWEDGKEKVADFVNEKGDGMSYPVAYVGKGGAFEKEWLKPAGVTGIPRALVVKDGKLLFGIHPASLKESTIEALLKGGEAQDAAIEAIVNGEKNRDLINGRIREFMNASREGDTEAMELALAAVRKIDSESHWLDRLTIELAVAKKDWETASKQLDEIEDPQSRAFTAMNIAQKIDKLEEAPSTGILNSVATSLIDAPEKHPLLDVALARTYWQLDRKSEAAAVARKLAIVPGEEYPKAPFEEFAASFEEGEPLGIEEMMRRVSQSMQEKRAVEGE